MKKNNLLTSLQASKILGFSPDYIRKLCFSGVIKAKKIGNNWLFNEYSIKNIKRKRKPKKG